MDNPALLMYVRITIFVLMFAMGVNNSVRELISLWRRPALLIRSLIAVVVLVPLVAGLLLWLFDLPVGVATGLAVLAAAPGAPLTTKRSQMAGGDATYAASLQLTLGLLAVAITPLTLALYYGLFELATERVTPFQVALQVAQVSFLPVVLGLLLQRIVPRFVGAIRKPVNVLANVLFLLLFVLLIVLLALVSSFRAMLRIGPLGYAAILNMVAVSLTIGHLLGGPSRTHRSTLAIASIARNVGLALFIANLSDYGQRFIPTLLTYMILGAIVAIPYGIWSKRRRA
jgi:BASS family bile acid:Na+ symporter